MTYTPGISTTALLLLTPLLAWRLYKRFRRLVSRQRLSRVRPWLTVCLFPLLLVLVALGASRHVEALAGLVGGIAAGVALAVYGLRLTRFENTPEGLYYTPSAHIGIALSVLMAGRLLYRLVQLYVFGGMSRVPPDDFARSPLTLVIFGALAAYYVGYAIGLLRWRMRVAREPAPAAQSLPPG